MAIEAIAGLMPIHLHLSKLAQRSSVQMSTLHQMHALHTFSGLHTEHTQHPLSPSFLTERQTDKVSGPLIEAVKHQPVPNEILTPLPMEGVQGLRLLDLFLDRFSHYPMDRAAKDPIYTQIAHLDIVKHHSCTFTGEAMICIAASPSSNTTLAQPVTGVRVYHLGKLIASIKRPTGICSPQDMIILFFFFKKINNFIGGAQVQSAPAGYLSTNLNNLKKAGTTSIQGKPNSHSIQQRKKETLLPTAHNGPILATLSLSSLTRAHT
jgi:hypothetical protein